MATLIQAAIQAALAPAITAAMQSLTATLSGLQQGLGDLQQEMIAMKSADSEEDATMAAGLGSKRPVGQVAAAAAGSGPKKPCFADIKV